MTPVCEFIVAKCGALLHRRVTREPRHCMFYFPHAWFEISFFVREAAEHCDQSGTNERADRERSRLRHEGEYRISPLYAVLGTLSLLLLLATICYAIVCLLVPSRCSGVTLSVCFDAFGLKVIFRIQYGKRSSRCFPPSRVASCFV